MKNKFLISCPCLHASVPEIQIRFRRTNYIGGTSYTDDTSVIWWGMMKKIPALSNCYLKTRFQFTTQLTGVVPENI
jgi:hypothetical protein